MKYSMTINNAVLVKLVLCIGLLGQLHTAFALDDVGEGRRAYLKYNCYSCHGMRAAGGMGPNIVNENDDIREAVLQGEEGGMPSYKNIITENEIKAMSAYLRSIKSNSDPYFMHWWEEVPSDLQRKP